MEAGVEAFGFESLDILQPSLLLSWRGEMRPLELLAAACMPLLNPLLRGSYLPYRAISARTVARGDARRHALAGAAACSATRTRASARSRAWRQRAAATHCPRRHPPTRSSAAAASSPCASHPPAQLAPGDLVFLHIRARSVDHVGIYSGGGRFIHAPRAGHAVEYADLYKGFYARRFVSAGRFC